MPTTTASEDKEAGEGDFADDDPLGDAVMEEDDEEVEDLYDNDGVSDDAEPDEQKADAPIEAQS